MFHVFVPLYELWQSRGNGFFLSQVIPHGFFKFKGVEIFVEKLMIGWIRRCTCLDHLFLYRFFLAMTLCTNFSGRGHMLKLLSSWFFKALMSGKYSWEINDWYLLFIIKFIMWPWCKISIYIMNNHVMVRYIFFIIIKNAFVI